MESDVKQNINNFYVPSLMKDLAESISGLLDTYKQISKVKINFDNTEITTYKDDIPTKELNDLFGMLFTPPSHREALKEFSNDYNTCFMGLMNNANNYRYIATCCYKEAFERAMKNDPSAQGIFIEGDNISTLVNKLFEYINELNECSNEWIFAREL